MNFQKKNLVSELIQGKGINNSLIFQLASSRVITKEANYWFSINY